MGPQLPQLHQELADIGVLSNSGSYQKASSESDEVGKTAQGLRSAQQEKALTLISLLPALLSIISSMCGSLPTELVVEARQLVLDGRCKSTLSQRMRNTVRRTPVTNLMILVMVLMLARRLQ